MADQPFWVKKTLDQMSPSEWEALCDGCGKCCLHKLEDDETGDVYYTKMACKLLDITTCQCSDYPHRKQRVDACLTLSPEDVDDFYWLPLTCSYRILHEGKALPEWHPLIVGDKTEMDQANITVSHFAKPETAVAEDQWQDQIIQWVL